ncbi:MAG: hypothetical protein V3V99_15240 [candidate division Zixibacteria bacterium]
MSSKYFIITLIFIASLLIIAPSAFAQQKRPIQISVFTPVQIFNENDPISGVRLSLLYGRSVSVTGLDWGLVNHTTTGVTKGVQWGFVGIADADFVGWQDNAVNIVKGNFEGFQWGIVNYANYANGFQLGLVNYARSMKGLQIGLVNIIKQGGQFPVFPIVNWSF